MVGDLLFVVFTERGENIRLISARLATERGGYIMTRTFTIKDGQMPTKEQLDEVKAAAKREIRFDEDSPELSPAMFKAFKCSVTQRNRRKKNA